MSSFHVKSKVKIYESFDSNERKQDEDLFRAVFLYDDNLRSGPSLSFWEFSLN